jgi:tyrosyl-tRNA synthetase
MTRTVHGESELAGAVQASQVLFGGELRGLPAEAIQDIFADVPSSSLGKAQLEAGCALVDLLVQSGLASSKGDARRSIAEGGIYLNNQRIEDASYKAGLADGIAGKFLVLRRGRKNYHLIKITGN